MTRQFQTAKLQMKMADNEHPKGVNRLFNNVNEHVTDQQIQDFGAVIHQLTGKQFVGANLINTSSVSA